MAVFLIAAALLAWIVVGWPGWLAMRARLAPRPFREDATVRSISIVICVRNGAAYLRNKLDSILKLDYPRELMEILVVSDGSTDGTDSIAREFASCGVRLLRLPFGGKPAAINAALEVASGEILVITDVRQPLEAGSVRRLVGCFADPQVGVASGELHILSEGGQGAATIGAYWRFESWIRRQLSAVDSMLGATGPFYAMRRALARRLPDEILLDDCYLPLGAFFDGYRLVVQPEARAFDYPTSVETEFHRKVRTLAGNWQLLRFCPHLLGFRNRMWLDYVSYKLGRLLLPYLLLALAVSSLYLSQPWRTLALSMQGAGYVLGLLDPVMPKWLFLKKLSTPLWTFLSMLAATVLSLQVWFVSPQQLWRVTQTATVGMNHPTVPEPVGGREKDGRE